MRYLYGVTVVNKKTDEVVLDKKVAAQTEVDAVLKAAAGTAIDQKKSDVVVRKLTELSKEPTVVTVEKEV